MAHHITYHIIVFSTDKVYLANEFILHVFRREKPDTSELLNLVANLAKRHRERVSIAADDVRYIGFEKLPIDVGEGYFLFVKPYRGCEFAVTLELAESAGKVDLERLAEWKRWRLTVDYDGNNASGWATKAFERLNSFGGVKLFAFYRTHAGAHLRVELSKSLNFDEKVRLRRLLNDDAQRVEYDEAFYKLGFEGLTDVLFNEKMWEARGGWAHYTEEPLVLNELELPFEIPTRVEGTNFVVDRKKVFLKTPVTVERAYWLLKSIEDNLWEYKFTQSRERDVRAMVVATYSEISPSLAKLVEKCEIRLEADAVVINVPKHLTDAVGRLIGRQGANVKAVEQKLGVRIRISQETPPPEDIQMKQRLQSLLKSVLRDEQ